MVSVIASHNVILAPLFCPAEEYMCPLAQKGKHMLVHWVYYPDSYDCWVPASEVGGAPEPTAELPKKWMVSSATSL